MTMISIGYDMLKDIINNMRKRCKDTDFKGGLEEYRNEVREIRKRIGGILKKAEATPTDTVGFIIVNC